MQPADTMTDDEMPKKLTWGEIKHLIESAGVKDSDEIDTVSISWGPIKDLEIKKDDDFGWQILL